MTHQTTCPTPLSDKPQIIGIVNVTPDSFSDGGRYLDQDKAISHGLNLIKQGAHILDIGGESTRPGAMPLSPEEEIKRVIPVIEGLRDQNVSLSVDTRNAKTMEAALKAGATIINDISALSHDPDSLSLASAASVPVILMHMQGNPHIMQQAPSYKNVVKEVFAYLQDRITICLNNGIGKEKLIADVGIGFGKTLDHNLALMNKLDHFDALGVPLLLGASRKRFIAQLNHDEKADDRLAGSLAAALWGLTKGVKFFRVHDVKETAQAFRIFHSCHAGHAPSKEAL